MASAKRVPRQESDVQTSSIVQVYNHRTQYFDPNWSESDMILQCLLDCKVGIRVNSLKFL